MAKNIVAGDLYETITGQLFEIGRQLRQPSGYPFDPVRLKEHLQNAIEGKFPPVLRPLKTLTLSTLPLHKSFFECPAFYFWDNFKNWILAKIPETIPVFEGNLVSYVLTKNMTDEEIIEELPSKKPFTIQESTAIIAALIQKQLNGEEGDLDVTGNANIFHCLLEGGKVAAVFVLWDAGSRQWGFYARRFGVSTWADGRRVFSRS